MGKNKLLKFNVKNVKYSILTAGVYGSVLDLAYANGISLEADYNEKKLYGDGTLIGVIGDDKGKTGTLSVINIEAEYEKACGRAMDVVGGLADIGQRKSQAHAIYYEVEAYEDGDTITIKNWLLNCVTGKPNEAYEQTQDDPTINTYDYPITVLGELLQNAAGDADAVDLNGNTTMVYRITAVPTDAGFATFGDTVPMPKETA